MDLNKDRGKILGEVLREFYPQDCIIPLAYYVFNIKGGVKVETNSCLKNHCYACENFKVTRNEFEKTFICSCILYRKGMTVPDVTLITPAAMLNGINWEDIK